MRTAVNIFTASPGAGSGAGSGSVVRFPTQSGGAVVVHIFTVHPEGEGGLQGARWGGERYLPYAFTEQGVAMLSSVLNSERAIQVNIAIMRAFVKLKAILSTHKELAHKLAELERKIERHDEEIKVIFDAIRQLMAPPEPKEKKIGFRVRERGVKYRISRHRKTKQ